MKRKNVSLIVLAVLAVVYLYVLSLFLLPFYLPEKDSTVKIDDVELTLDEQ